MPRSLLLLAAGLGWLAVGTQFVLSIRTGIANGHGPWHGVVEYFGFFTLLTNILCAAILTAFVTASASRVGQFLRRPGVVTAAATSIIVVGVVYHLLLAALWDPQGIDRVVDTLLHTVNPLLFVFAWTRLVPRGAVRIGDAPLAAGYMVGYAAYILVRGELVGRYPYPFIDVSQLGYPLALRNAALLGVAFVALSGLMVGLNRIVGAPRTSES
jgi:hypothetical protein